MQLHLVRHGVTTETGSRLTGRLPGVGLSPAGEAQAQAAAGGLASHSVDALYTSPIQRCRETARIIGSAVELRPSTDARLQEVDYGSWQGRRLSALRKLKAWQNLFVSASRFRFPDGETLLEAQHRVVAAIEEMAVAHRNRTVVVVSHADMIRVALAHYLGMPLDMVHRLDVRPASISTVVLRPDAFPVVPVVNHVEYER